MGYFSVTCGISSLPISEGDSIGMVLLMPNEGSSLLPSRSLSMNTDAYKPFSAPIYGEYNDYGGLDNIVRDDTVTLLEEYFGLNIDTILECIDVDRSIYSSYNPIFKHLYNGKINFNRWNATAEENMTAIGFTPMENGDFSYREHVVRLTNVPLVGYPDVNGIFEYDAIDSNGNKTRIQDQTQSFDDFMDSFTKMTGIYFGYNKADLKKIEIFTKMSAMFFKKDIFDGMISHFESNSESFSLSTFDKWWDGFKEDFKAYKDSGWTDPLDIKFKKICFETNNMHRYFTDVMSFPKDKLNLILEQDSLAFVEIFKLEKILVRVNRIFRPSYAGSQDGDMDALKALYTMSLAVVDERLKAWAEDDEDES